MRYYLLLSCTIHRPKRCEYNNKDEDNGTNTLNDKNYQASFLKFRQEFENNVVNNKTHQVTMMKPIDLPNNTNTY